MQAILKKDVTTDSSYKCKCRRENTKTLRHGPGAHWRVLLSWLAGAEVSPVFGAQRMWTVSTLIIPQTWHRHAFGTHQHCTPGLRGSELPRLLDTDVWIPHKTGCLLKAAPWPGMLLMLKDSQHFKVINVHSLIYQLWNISINFVIFTSYFSTADWFRNI